MGLPAPEKKFGDIFSRPDTIHQRDRQTDRQTDGRTDIGLPVILANAVSALLHPEHGTLYRYISVSQPSADNSSSLGSKLISSNAPRYDFYLRELLRSELTYLLTYVKGRGFALRRAVKRFCSGQIAASALLNSWPRPNYSRPRPNITFLHNGKPCTHDSCMRSH